MGMDYSALKNHMDAEGRLKTWPSAGKHKALQGLALQFLAEKFEVGRVYTEKEVNAILNQHHTFEDHALLRRELFEAGLLNRQKDGSQYWRTAATTFISD